MRTFLTVPKTENCHDLAMHFLLNYKHMRLFARLGTICTILKNVKNTHGAVLTKSNTPPWIFFTLF